MNPPVAVDAALPGAWLRPFHDVTVLRWDESSGTGRIEAVRHNRLDDWYYACHFLGDPVMPGCWGVDAVWQCLRAFAAWRGLPACRPLGMEDVRFFGQIRPGDEKIVYAVDILSVEQEGGEFLITGRGEVSVDGVKVYSIGSAQVGTSLWETDERRDMPPPMSAPRLCAPLTHAQFKQRSAFSPAEIVAIAQGTLVENAPPELGLLPCGPMLEIGSVQRISYDESRGDGLIAADRDNSPDAWFYPMNAGQKPAALSIDAVWQLIGLFLSWRGHLGTGRALGFEQVDLFGEIGPGDRRILYEVAVSKEGSTGGDAFVRADAKVFADGRHVLTCQGASVGCHKGIRYAGYPRDSRMARGGKVLRQEEAR